MELIVFLKRSNCGPWLVGNGNNSSSGNSNLSILCQMSLEIPKTIADEPMGPADKTARDNCEVSVVVGVFETSNMFTWSLVGSCGGSISSVGLISGMSCGGNWMSSWGTSRRVKVFWNCLNSTVRISW